MLLEWLPTSIVPKRVVNHYVKIMVSRVSLRWCTVIQPHQRYETWSVVVYIGTHNEQLCVGGSHHSLFDFTTLQKYEGGRDFDSLSAFAAEHLTVVYCSIKNMDTCSDEEKALIGQLRSKTKEELDAIVAATTELTSEANDKYEKDIEELQATYERITEEFNAQNDKIRKESNIKWVNQILSIDFPTADGAEDEL